MVGGRGSLFAVCSSPPAENDPEPRPKTSALLLNPTQQPPPEQPNHFKTVNEFVKRVRALKIHMLLVGHIRKAMPAMFGKDKAQRRVLEELPEVFYAVRRNGCVVLCCVVLCCVCRARVGGGAT